MSLFPPDIEALATRVLAAARARDWKIATAESCTGGLVAAALTEIPGSSDVLDRGFVSYSNPAKQKLFGVPAHILANRGAVSEPVARAMAEGALAASNAQLVVAITGVAGPGGGTAAKPVGLVYFATAATGSAEQAAGVRHHEARFGDLGRSEVRLAAVRTALELLLERMAA